MPVLFSGASGRPEKARAPAAAVDVETLVSEVRERLCLKKHEKFYPSRRALPYQRTTTHCEHCRTTTKHFSSPSSVFQQRPRHKQRDQLVSACSSCSPKLNCKSKEPSSLQCIEDAQDMLEKLISEQSLIQEAVRRLQAQRQTQNLVVKPCLKDRIFSVSNEDSNDADGDAASGFTFTPSYSESEDDSLSQHSVDL